MHHPQKTWQMHGLQRWGMKTSYLTQIPQLLLTLAMTMAFWMMEVLKLSQRWGLLPARPPPLLLL